MSDTMASLSRKITSAGDLQSVVRTMKALAASSIGQYEQSVRSLTHYYRTVEMGLGVCLRETNSGSGQMDRDRHRQPGEGEIMAIVFGSDQGLVGQFNDIIADHASRTLAAFPGVPKVWAVGERVHSRLSSAGMSMSGHFPVPNSMEAITPLVTQIQIQVESQVADGNDARLLVFHNSPHSGALYEPVHQVVLPLDAAWQQHVTRLKWPSKLRPEVLNGRAATLRVLIREYLFISVFRACAESLTSENASRLAAMERAERNIEELLETLHSNFHRLRQSSIDEELSDVISGYEALAK